MEWWPWIGLAAGVYCIARGIADLRERRYGWGALGLLAGPFLLLTPIQTQSVTLDLPAEMAPQAAGPTANPRG